MESPDTTPDAVVEIASDGDLILVVGPEETRLRVSSKLLMTASKPFSAMLGPNWKEGHDLRNQHGSFELVLPEDNAAALNIICSVVHHQNEKFPRTLAPRDVFAVAVATDKYDFASALRFASEIWLRTSEEDPSCLILLTASAYVFRNAEAFNEITRALLLTYNGSFLALYIDEFELIMPWKIFCLLEERRGHAKLDLFQILLSHHPMIWCDNECGWTGNYQQYVNFLADEGLSPAALVETSIARALKKVDMLRDLYPDDRSSECQSAKRHKFSNCKQERRVVLDKFVENIGLCLSCTRLSRLDFDCDHPFN